jgi:hypothetical protein
MITQLWGLITPIAASGVMQQGHAPSELAAEFDRQLQQGGFHTHFGQVLTELTGHMAAVVLPHQLKHTNRPLVQQSKQLPSPGSSAVPTQPCGSTAMCCPSGRAPPLCTSAGQRSICSSA